MGRRPRPGRVCAASIFDYAWKNIFLLGQNWKSRIDYSHGLPETGGGQEKSFFVGFTDRLKTAFFFHSPEQGPLAMVN